MIDCAINVLPDPVSPMRAKLSPGKIWKETPQTSSFSVRSNFAVSYETLCCCVGIRQKYIQSYFNIGFHLEEASRGDIFQAKFLQGLRRHLEMRGHTV